MAEIKIIRLSIKQDDEAIEAAAEHIVTELTNGSSDGK